MVFLKLTNKLKGVMESCGFKLNETIESLCHPFGTDLYSSKTLFESQLSKTKNNAKHNSTILFRIILGILCFPSVFIVSSLFTFVIRFWTIETR